MTDLRIENATILTCDASDRIIDGGVVIRDGKIASVGEIRPEDAGLPRLNFGGDYLMPGLVQGHIHLCQTLFRHEAEGRPLLRWLQERIWPFEAAHTPDTLRVSAELGVAELLRCGTTCLLDMGTVRHQDSIFEVLERTGIRAGAGKAMMDFGEGTPTGLLERTAASLDESLSLARHWHGAAGDRIRYFFAPRSVLSCSGDLQQEIGRLSAAHGYGIHTHSSEHPEELAAVEAMYGRRSIDVLDSFGLCSERSVFAHGVHLDPSERRTLADTGTTICHCPSSNLKLGSGIADTVTLLREGINVAIGADGAPCNNGLDVFVEMRLAHLLQGPRHGPGALTPRDVFRMATTAGARALGWADRIGVIEPGRDADLVRLRRDDPRLGPGGDPWTRIVCAGMRDLVRDVWVRGHRVVESGTLTVLDEDRLRSEAPAALRAVFDGLESI